MTRDEPSSFNLTLMTFMCPFALCLSVSISLCYHWNPSNAFLQNGMPIVFMKFNLVLRSSSLWEAVSSF